MSVYCAGCEKRKEPATIIGNKIFCKECYDAFPNGLDISKPLSFNEAILNYKKPKTMSEKIPFDIEKWESGEYEAVYRNGEKPIDILISNKLKYAAVISIGLHGVVRSHSDNGFYSVTIDTPYDIFLTPKKKKGWVVVYEVNGHIDDAILYFDCKRKELSKDRRKEVGHKILHESEFEY